MSAIKVIFGRKGLVRNSQAGAQPKSHASKKATSSTKVTFGTVEVHVRRPVKAEVSASIEYSTQALKRSKKKLVTSGVAIREKKNVPLYSVDENDTDKFIRKLNGRIERGVLEGGVFKVTS